MFSALLIDAAGTLIRPAEPVGPQIITSGHAKASKPDPAIFRQTLDLLGLQPTDAAHVGDSPEADLAGAQAAGIPAFHLRRPDLSLHDFLDFCQSAIK